MSEIPPTVGPGASAPDEPVRMPRLTEEAEGVLRRRSGCFRRNISRLIDRLNITSAREAIGRENEIILNALRTSVSERYGRSIADRSVRILLPPATVRGAGIDRRAVAAGFQYAQETSEEIRNRSEVKAFLQGGDAFSAMCRRFNPPGGETVRRFERCFIDAVAGLHETARADQIAEFARTAAKECFEPSVRLADEVKLDYRQLAAELAGVRTQHRRLGCYCALGLSPTTTFASFAKTDASGNLLTVSREAPVISLQDKVHLSVNRQDVAKAWEVLRPFLLSESNPFLRWKMTMLENEERALTRRLERIAERARTAAAGPQADKERMECMSRFRRITEGAQFTLYAYANVGDPAYQSNGADFRHYLAQIDRELAGHGVTRGEIPGSDAQIEGLAFVSYRNKTIGTRGASVGEAPMTEKVIEELKCTPFYLAITPRRS